MFFSTSLLHTHQAYRNAFPTSMRTKPSDYWLPWPSHVGWATAGWSWASRTVNGGFGVFYITRKVENHILILLAISGTTKCLTRSCHRVKLLNSQCSLTEFQLPHAPLGPGEMVMCYLLIVIQKFISQLCRGRWSYNTETVIRKKIKQAEVRYKRMKNALLTNNGPIVQKIGYICVGSWCFVIFKALGHEVDWSRKLTQIYVFHKTHN